MNYHHAYHAGNFADVVKHIVLVALIESLKQKQTPFHVIDTHAGAGRYDLLQPEAQKTGEYRDGIARLLGVERLPTLVHAYLNLVRLQQPHTAGFSVYPGSPQIARLMLRDQDRLTLCELQEEESIELRRLFRGDSRVSVHTRDGYEALNGLVPPKEKRGLVLIDPPFEAQEDEFKVIQSTLAMAQLKWPTGIYAIWYPIKLRAPIQRFHRALRSSG
ncbi:MAG: 23S rRNA (adenine(2030)-N(6))-methyltransferase RlmJ, partial [Ahniella sp.]|nr:23S rRNA (adenine(2030)-N(6))-methyltransferase RlmJ [Ahniella sp.]